MSMTESEAKKQLVRMVRTAGLAALPVEATWEAVLTALEVTLLTYARQVQDREAQQRGTYEELQELRRAISGQQAEERTLRDQAKEYQEEIAELRSNPDMAKWHERATVAEEALRAHTGVQALLSDWLEDLRGYLGDAHDKVMRAYEIDSELSAARDTRWRSEKLQGVK